MRESCNITQVALWKAPLNPERVLIQGRTRTGRFSSMAARQLVGVGVDAGFRRVMLWYFIGGRLVLDGVMNFAFNADLLHVQFMWCQFYDKMFSIYYRHILYGVM